MDPILEEFRVFLLETGRIQSELTTDSYLGNVKQLFVWLNDEQVRLEKLDKMHMLNYLKHLERLNYKATICNVLFI